MPKGSKELTAQRKEEIIQACKKLYKTISFKDITLKQIADAPSFTRTSIYNYFETKEEIFLAILQKEYESWIDDLNLLKENKKMSKKKLAQEIARSIDNHPMSLVIAVIGLYLFVRNGMHNYILFKEAFAFFDYDKPAILVFIENIMILISWVFIASQVMELIQKKR